MFLKFNILVFDQSQLVVMEEKKRSEQKIKIPQQRKTTLKWGTNGELSPIDMVRILDRLNDQDLTECEISCESEKNL